jgi:hypothetical protein
MTNGNANFAAVLNPFIIISFAGGNRYGKLRCAKSEQKNVGI